MAGSNRPTKLIIGIVAVIAIVVILLGTVLTYNSLVKKQQDVRRT
jgi:hypothetical protein